MSNPQQPTRQQLDELEALMQQMLALPVHPADEDLVPIKVSPSPIASINDKQSSPRTDLLATAIRTTPGVDEWHERSRELAEIGSQDHPGSSTFRRAEGPAEVSGPGLRMAAEADPLPRLAGPEPPRVSNHLDRGERRPSLVIGMRPSLAWWCRPLVGLNRAFDRGVNRFGPAGRWLRGPRGRACLGGIGLLLLAGSAVWVLLELQGWPW